MIIEPLRDCLAVVLNLSDSAELKELSEYQNSLNSPIML